MKEDRIKYLYQRFNERSATDAEVEEFYLALADPQVEALIKNMIGDTWESQVHSDMEHLSDSRAKEIHDQITAIDRSGPAKKKKLWPAYAVAAAIATIILSTGIWFLHDKSQDRNLQQAANAYDLAPGHTGATLTLSNGKQIKLSDAGKGQLAQQGGVSILKTSDGSIVYQGKGDATEENVINTLSTANGETYQLRLPDGSLVWLNAASTLSYSVNLIQGGKRTVKLSGEGYFEVAKDKAHPFVVESRNQKIQVLGTHFNVNSYSDEPVVKTALLEGSVEVQVAGSSGIIKPGEQAVVRGDELKVSAVNVEEAVAWKNGLFKFNKTSLKAVMRQMSRWYDVEIVYEGDVPDKLFTGEVYRNQNASQVLGFLKFYKLNYRLEKEKIIVSP